MIQEYLLSYPQKIHFRGREASNRLHRWHYLAKYLALVKSSALALLHFPKTGFIKSVWNNDNNLKSVF